MTVQDQITNDIKEAKKSENKNTPSKRARKLLIGDILIT